MSSLSYGFKTCVSETTDISNFSLFVLTVHRVLYSLGLEGDLVESCVYFAGCWVVASRHKCWSAGGDGGAGGRTNSLLPVCCPVPSISAYFLQIMIVPLLLFFYQFSAVLAIFKEPVASCPRHQRWLWATRASGVWVTAHGPVPTGRAISEPSGMPSPSSEF